jgi:hypothetical protein
MIEGASAAHHRFLAHCRLLMLHQPMAGATLYEVALGRSACRLGWNVMHRAPGSTKPTGYIYIEAESGKYTEKKPDVPDDALNYVYEPQLESLDGTVAWAQLCNLRERVAAHASSIPDADQVLAHADHIEQYPVSGSAALVEAYLTGFEQHLRAASSRDCSVDDLLLPAITIVLSFLDLVESGGHAAQVLDWILMRCSQLPSSLKVHTDADLWFLSADHLDGATSSLLRDRDKRSLAGFLDMTYLALLYGDTAYGLYTHLLASQKLTPHQRKIISKRRLALDERLAHDAGPSLLHPVTYLPCGPDEYRLSERGFRPETGLYPGATACQVEPFAAETVWAAMERHSSAALPALSHEDLVRAYTPLPPELREHLTGFLLGAQMRRRE